MSMLSCPSPRPSPNTNTADAVDAVHTVHAIHAAAPLVLLSITIGKSTH